LNINWRPEGVICFTDTKEEPTQVSGEEVKVSIKEGSIVKESESIKCEEDENIIG